MKTFRLLALTPPQDIEMVILTLRSYIFSHYGYSSALALPVMAPLCPVRIDISPHKIRKALEKIKFHGFPMTTSKPVDYSGSLFLEIEKSNDLEVLTAECRAFTHYISANQDVSKKINDTPFIPLYNGFFLAKNEQNTDVLEILINYPGSHAITFKQFYIVLLTVNIHANINTWWENSDWEILVQVKSRK